MNQRESIEHTISNKNADENDDASLVADAQANPAAFDALYTRYAQRVYRYLRTHLRNDEDATDMTQQVFLQALRALPSYQERGLPFAAWLFQIARHTATDAYRRQHTTLSWHSLPPALEPLREQDPETLLLRQERLSHLNHLVARLDPAKRELLALRFSAGLSTPQIAAVVGKSQAAVKKQLTRILHQLKEHYDER